MRCACVKGEPLTWQCTSPGLRLSESKAFTLRPSHLSLGGGWRMLLGRWNTSWKESYGSTADQWYLELAQAVWESGEISTSWRGYWAPKKIGFCLFLFCLIFFHIPNWHMLFIHVSAFYTTKSIVSFTVSDYQYPLKFTLRWLSKEGSLMRPLYFQFFKSMFTKTNEQTDKT